MIQLKRTPLHRSVFVVALTALALLVSLLLRPLLEPNFLPLFFAAVFCSAWFYGFSGGILATVLSSLAIFYFFLSPALSWSISSGRVVIHLLSFAAISLLITWVTASWRGSRGLLSATLTSIGDAVLATGRGGHVTFMNSVAEALTGWRESEARGKPLSSVFRLIHQDTREEIPSPTPNALGEGGAVSIAERARLIARDGTEIAIEHSAAPILNDGGKLRGVILVFRDVTGRRQLEEQLSHSQKMEAVGRLAGGVAGDFNNLLTVITGYSELLRGELTSASPLRRFAEEILYAAERAAALTRQLLAFSRGQAAQPKLLDLNVVLAGMEPLMRRLLGQNNDLILLPDPHLGRIHADPAQIEQVIMNLATNAREAMPDGGKLVLETANVEVDDAVSSKKIGVPSGPYVMLAVSDTGVGMDAEVRSHLFEPFFTTKEQGKGSGLGLSTVYGIIRQSGGQITVYSQVGCGTIFEIYLPQAKEAVEVEAPGVPVPPVGSETVLLVDDEEGVRKLVCAVLQSHGYSVIEAGNGAAALLAYEKNAHKIDLVLTDVVMPQMDGFELGQRLAEKNSTLKILYMSGYRDNPIGRSDVPPSRPFLHKPFTPDVLLAKVREILDTRAVG
jgi:two-component system, cell cycle sensor histidine kinase and response regulator CckA